MCICIFRTTTASVSNIKIYADIDKCQTRQLKQTNILFLLLAFSLCLSCASRVCVVGLLRCYGHVWRAGCVEVSTPRSYFVWDTKTHLFVAHLLLHKHCLLTKKYNTKTKTCRRTFFLYSAQFIYFHDCHISKLAFKRSYVLADAECGTALGFVKNCCKYYFYCYIITNTYNK